MAEGARREAEVNEEEGQADNAERQRPTHETPTGVGFLDETRWGVEESEKAEQKIANGRWQMASLILDSGFWILDTIPDQVDAEKRNGPAVGVLRVEIPLDAELADQLAPEKKQWQCAKRKLEPWMNSKLHGRIGIRKAETGKLQGAKSRLPRESTKDAKGEQGNRE